MPLPFERAGITRATRRRRARHYIALSLPPRLAPCPPVSRTRYHGQASRQNARASRHTSRCRYCRRFSSGYSTRYAAAAIFTDADGQHRRLTMLAIFCIRLPPGDFCFRQPTYRRRRRRDRRQPRGFSYADGVDTRPQYFKPGSAAYLICACRSAQAFRCCFGREIL